jgi:hypothetical protein
MNVVEQSKSIDFGHESQQTPLIDSKHSTKKNRMIDDISVASDISCLGETLSQWPEIPPENNDGMKSKFLAQPECTVDSMTAKVLPVQQHSNVNNHSSFAKISSIQDTTLTHTVNHKVRLKESLDQYLQLVQKNDDFSKYLEKDVDGRYIVPFHYVPQTSLTTNWDKNTKKHISSKEHICSVLGERAIYASEENQNQLKNSLICLQQSVRDFANNIIELLFCIKADELNMKVGLNERNVKTFSDLINCVSNDWSDENCLKVFHVAFEQFHQYPTWALDYGNLYMEKCGIKYAKDPGRFGGFVERILFEKKAKR